MLECRALAISSLMLHVYNGDSTANTARAAAIPGEHVSWREALVCGPAPEGLSENEFIEARAQHLAAGYNVTVDKCRAELQAMHAACREPKRLVSLPGRGHYSAYVEHFVTIRDEALAWFGAHV